MAGSETVARHFPFVLGRSAQSDLILQDDGIWEKHCELFPRGLDIVLKPHGEAMVSVNSIAVGETVLRNGDTISMGGAKLRFWLSDSVSRKYRWREWLTWALFVAVLAVQFYLIYYLSR